MAKLDPVTSINIRVSLAVVRGYTRAALEDAVWLHSIKGMDSRARQEVSDQLQAIQDQLQARLLFIDNAIDQMTDYVDD